MCYLKDRLAVKVGSGTTGPRTVTRNHDLVFYLPFLCFQCACPGVRACVCTREHMCIYTCVCVHVCIRVCDRACTHLYHVFLCTCVYLCVSVYTCVYLYVCVSVSVHTYVCAHVCVLVDRSTSRSESTVNKVRVGRSLCPRRLKRNPSTFLGAFRPLPPYDPGFGGSTVPKAPGRSPRTPESTLRGTPCLQGNEETPG